MVHAAFTKPCRDIATKMLYFGEKEGAKCQFLMEAKMKLGVERKLSFLIIMDLLTKCIIMNTELLIQSEINKTSLPVVKYYKTEEPNVIKMDLIHGMTLGDRMRKEKYKNGVEDIISIQKNVHTFTDVNLPTFKSYAMTDICEIQIGEEEKNIALKFLDEIPDKKNLLHLDFHFLNIMYADNQYYIIDWINARIGNPIYDYARSYVIMNEFAYRLSRKYLSLITKDKCIDTTDFKKAIFVMALLRIRENCNDKTLELIKSMENEFL